MMLSHGALQWLDLARGMMAESEWTLTGHVPSSLEEYIEVAVPAFGLGVIALTTLYLAGPELTEEVVRSQEYEEMLWHVGASTRLLNDLQTYKREEEQGKTNSVLLLAPRHGGSIEAAKREVRSVIAASRRELLRLVVRDGCAGTRSLRQEFWNIYKVGHLLYSEEDGWCTSSSETIRAGNAVVHEPLSWRPGGKIGSPAAARRV